MAKKTFTHKEWKASQSELETRKWRAYTPAEWSAMFKTANDEKMNIAQFCRRFDVTRNTVAAWVKRMQSDANAAEFALRTQNTGRGRPRKSPAPVQVATETVEAISSDAINVIVELAHGVRVAFKAPIDDALRFAGRYQ